MGALSGLRFNDMGRLASLATNPDMPVCLALSPARFLIGLLAIGGLVAGGVSVLLKGAKPAPRIALQTTDQEVRGRWEKEHVF
jgi:hypothetical protein